MPEDLAHLMTPCRAKELARHNIFGPHNTILSRVIQDVGLVLAYLRRRGASDVPLPLRYGPG